MARPGMAGRRDGQPAPDSREFRVQASPRNRAALSSTSPSCGCVWQARPRSSSRWLRDRWDRWDRPERLSGHGEPRGL